MVPIVRARWSVSASRGRHERKGTAWPSNAARIPGKTSPTSRCGTTRPLRRVGAEAQNRPSANQADPPGDRSRFARGLAVAVLLVVMQPWRVSDTYATNVGKLRTVILEDGTRMSLNTCNSRASSAGLGATHGESRGRRGAVRSCQGFPSAISSCGWAIARWWRSAPCFPCDSPATRVIGSDALDVTLIEGRVKCSRCEAERATRRRRRDPFS